MAVGKLINEQLGTLAGGWAGSREYSLDLIHRISIRWTKMRQERAIWAEGNSEVGRGWLVLLKGKAR